MNTNLQGSRCPASFGRVIASLSLVALAILLSGRGHRAQSLSYSRGQNVTPAFEGWETNADGSSSFLFGYMNANWEEEVDVPIGPDNSFDLLGADLGQPTHFLPRRNRFVFKVPVPKGFGNQELVWTLTSHGVTDSAYASLRPDYFIDNVVIASETGALGAGWSDPTMRANKPPAVTVEGEQTRRVQVGQPLQLVAFVTDDGIPQAPGQGAPMPDPETVARQSMMPPHRITVDKALGLYLSWFVYRGSGKVTFDPVQVKPWEDTRAGANSPWAPLWIVPPLPPANKWVAQATFDTPGTYLLRARADDGGLLADAELTVTVTR
ncbi:MAG: hypothetical protein GEU82_08870 [Luteitalea sp.]|nr:hypothetical protein [Luteitalea sp.]